MVGFRKSVSNSILVRDFESSPISMYALADSRGARIVRALLDKLRIWNKTRGST
ncbi:hypothetical protein LguiA_034165 [Lonicera macranthoides]